MSKHNRNQFLIIIKKVFQIIMRKIYQIIMKKIFQIIMIKMSQIITIEIYQKKIFQIIMKKIFQKKIMYRILNKKAHLTQKDPFLKVIELLKNLKLE